MSQLFTLNQTLVSMLRWKKPCSVTGNQFFFKSRTPISDEILLKDNFADAGVLIRLNRFLNISTFQLSKDKIRLSFAP